MIGQVLSPALQACMACREREKIFIRLGDDGPALYRGISLAVQKDDSEGLVASTLLEESLEVFSGAEWPDWVFRRLGRISDRSANRNSETHGPRLFFRVQKPVDDSEPLGKRQDQED
jgi:hypothetical protein